MMIVDSQSLTRAAVSAGVFSGIAWLMTGGGAAMNDYVVSAGVQAAASLGSDVVHQVLAMYPTNLTSAAVTGALYTTTQYVMRGEENWLNNYGVSAAAEWGARSATQMVEKKTLANAAADAEAVEGLIETY